MKRYLITISFSHIYTVNGKIYNFIKDDVVEVADTLGTELEALNDGINNKVVLL